MANFTDETYRVTHFAQLLKTILVFCLLIASVADECQGNDSRCKEKTKSLCKALKASGAHCRWVKTTICETWCAGHEAHWEAKCNFDACIECNPCASLSRTTSTALPAATDEQQSATANSDDDDSEDTFVADIASQANVTGSDAGAKAAAAEVPVIPIGIGAGSVLVLCVAIGFGRLRCMHGAQACRKDSDDKDLEANNVTNSDAALETEDETHGTAIEYKVPQHWLNQKGAFSARTNVSDGVLGEIQNLLDSTFTAVRTRDRKDGAVPSKLQVVSVQRLENSDLWRNYSEAFSQLTMQRKTCTPLERCRGGSVKTSSCNTSLLGQLNNAANEVFLWHGTSSKAAESILREGFNLDVPHAHGGLYGKGVYLAECSSKSDEYAVESTDGSFKGAHCVLLCRALLGEVLTLTKGVTKGDETASTAIDAFMKVGYDSVLGDREATSETYREFVLYNQDRVYPEYVVFYKRQM